MHRLFRDPANGLRLAVGLAMQTGAQRFAAMRAFGLLVFATALTGLSEATLQAADEISQVNQCHVSGNPAIRPRSPLATAAIEYGLKRSPTLAAEFEALQQSDMVAYIDVGPVIYSGVSGYVTFISKTTQCRYVRIALTARLNLSQTAALIGHELQHVLEIAAHAEVVDAESLREMYEWFGRHGLHQHSYESAEAIEAGQQVAAELFGGANAKSFPVVTER
jgi:hypothetical protein